MPIKTAQLWESDSITDEVLDIVWNLAELHYPGKPINWKYLMHVHLYCTKLADGRYLSLNGAEGSPAWIRITQEILRRRREQ